MTMTTGRTDEGLRRLRASLLRRDGAGYTDGQLLEGFVSRRDEAAFEAVVRRHGPMVLGVCRRVLRHVHDAEDAFQATFLVLARKAGSIASRERLAGWLYGVAYHTALKARAVRARRGGRESQVTEMPEPEATREAAWEDLQPLLDRELSRLPDKYRLPVILCDLEGKTHKEAAQSLGWPVGTLSGRLARARKVLAGRLTRRGIALSGGTLAVALSQEAASASVPAALASSTARGAALFAAGWAAAAGTVPARVIALTESVMKTMLAAKLRGMSALALGVALLVTSAGGLATGFDPAAFAQDGAAVEELIRRLDSPRFADREAASQALAKVGEPALEALRRAAAQGATLESRRRAEKLIRDIERRWQLRCFVGHTDAVPRAALSPDGKRAISAGRSESDPRLWDVDTGKELRRFEGHSSWVWTVAYSPNGKQVLSGGADAVLRLWDADTGKQLRVFQGHTMQVYRCAWSADGKRVVSGGQDTTVRLWDVDTGKELRVFGGHRGEVVGVALSPDGRRVVSCGGDGVTRLWDADTGDELRPLPGATAVTFLRDGRRVLAGCADGTVRVWDVESGKVLRRFTGHAQAVHCVAVSRDGKRLLSGGDDLTVRLWDMESGKELRCFRGHEASLSSVAFSADGRRALSASYDRTLRLWALPK
jgi:RNA polymerase sigma factor (sigma-70 family)